MKCPQHSLLLATDVWAGTGSDNVVPQTRALITIKHRQIYAIWQTRCKFDLKYHKIAVKTGEEHVPCHHLPWKVFVKQLMCC